MIYVFHGDDSQRLRTKVKDLISSLLKKKPDALHLKITPDEWTDSTLAETVGSQGLFSDKLIVQLDGLLAGDTKEVIVGALDDIKESDNIFILVESSVDAKTLKTLEKKSEKIQEFASAMQAEREPSMFALADAFGRRDRKLMWVEYQKARQRESVPEEIHGMIFWQLKSMLLASKTSIENSGLKPFVYNKSKQFAKNYSPTELENISAKLVAMYHDAHRGLIDFDAALETFALEL